MKKEKFIAAVVVDEYGYWGVGKNHGYATAYISGRDCDCVRPDERTFPKKTKRRMMNPDGTLSKISKNELSIDLFNANDEDLFHAVAIADAHNLKIRREIVQSLDAEYRSIEKFH